MRRLLEALRLWRLSSGKSGRAYRPILRHVRRQRATRILHIGVGDTLAAQRLIRAGLVVAGSGGVEYTGIDLFEMRAAIGLPGVSLKLAHKKLAPLGAKVRLVPGDAFSALGRVANSLAGQQVVVIAGDQDAESLRRAWFYIPRVLGESAAVFVESIDAQGESRFDEVPRDEVIRRSRHATERRAA